MTRWRGFTFVELIVVLSILGVLLSTLLPTMSATRTQAKALQCKSRMRGFHQWITMHALDKKYYPVNSTWGGLVDWDAVSGATTDSFNGDFATMVGVYVPSGFDQKWDSRASKNAFLCPAYDYDPGSTANPGHIFRQAHMNSGRVMNYQISAAFGYGRLSTQPKMWWPKRYGAHPGLKRVLMGEIYSKWSGIGYYGAGNRISPHNGATNTLLVGGSVLSQKLQECPQNDPANGFFYYGGWGKQRRR